MSDILCRICGEPWDTYYLRAEAPAWVMPLVVAGAGCESCEGSRASDPAKADVIALASDRAFVIDSPLDSEPLTDRPALNGGEPPTWKRPADPLVWECAAKCGTRIYRNLDWSERSQYAFRAECEGGYRAACDLGIERDSEARTAQELTDTVSCDGEHCRLCVVKCARCNATVGTSYDSPVSQGFPPPGEYGRSLLCEDCFSLAEYESACEAYSFSDLLSTLGYDRRSVVRAWFDSRRDITMAEATEIGMCEIEGDHVIYQRVRERDRLARKLRLMRGIVRGTA